MMLARVERFAYEVILDNNAAQEMKMFRKWDCISLNCQLVCVDLHLYMFSGKNYLLSYRNMLSKC